VPAYIAKLAFGTPLAVPRPRPDAYAEAAPRPLWLPTSNRAAPRFDRL